MWRSPLSSPPEAVISAIRLTFLSGPARKGQDAMNLLLRGSPHASAPAASAPRAQDEKSPAPQPLILCRACRHAVTREEERIAMGSAHRHTFANPSGIVFEIGCFRNAPGCAAVGPLSAEFTWFAGYSWQIGVCAACRLHLGWRFVGADRFFGLILDRLIAPD
jgi:hypothetical protein